MLKKTLKGIAVLVLLALVVLGWKAWPVYQLAQEVSPSTAPGDYAKQDDSRIQLTAPGEPEPRQYDSLKNVYWGELHVHTSESLDAVLFGTRTTVEDAYRFARGEPLQTAGGEFMQLSRPLDFVAITDHAEGFGVGTRCTEPDLPLTARVMCRVLRTPGLSTATLLGSRNTRMAVEPDPMQPAGVYRNRPRDHPLREDNPVCGGEGGGEACLRAGQSDWARYIELANRHYEPGVFTTFPAYEFSPVMEGAGSLHRNVIFSGEDLPVRAISAQDVGNAIELWRGLDEACTGRCDFLTIPHNMNKSWGLFYSRHTWDGGTYSEEDWRLRKRREPLAEMYQVKGASECALGVGATDEECAFEQFLKPCEQGQETGCAFDTSFAREGLKTGMQLHRELGFNPLAFGFVAATDAHNSNPGDVEEWDFRGGIGAVSSPAIRRLNAGPEAPMPLLTQSPGGLAAVWAEENTRDAIFAGMKRREAYATSGPRIALRFFAGWGFDAAIVDAHNPVAVATEDGVPMGGVLQPEDDGAGSPTFFAWAGADSMSAPLQRIQVVKGWIDAGGETHESVRDVICSDGLEVDRTTLRCPDNGTSVDTRSCQTSGKRGAAQLMVAWQDEDFDASQGAFYYVRAIQNPTCRWSTYDAIRLGIEPDPRVPATIYERAWSSPIWIVPES